MPGRVRKCNFFSFPITIQARQTGIYIFAQKPFTHIFFVRLFKLGFQLNICLFYETLIVLGQNIKKILDVIQFSANRGLIRGEKMLIWEIYFPKVNVSNLRANFRPLFKVFHMVLRNKKFNNPLDTGVR